MLNKRIADLLSTDKNSRLLIIDKDGFVDEHDVAELLESNGFEVIHYASAEGFRILFEEIAGKIAVIVPYGMYVPYDIQKSFRKVSVSLADIFPKLNGGTLKKYARDLELISFAYDSCYEDCLTAERTEDFLRDVVFTARTAGMFCQAQTKLIAELCEKAVKYTDWIFIAKKMAAVRYYSVKYGIQIELLFVDMKFSEFIRNAYGSLRMVVNREYPPIVTKTLNVVTGGGNSKVAIIVMDGMSLLDFEVLSRYFDGIEYEYFCSYSIIPTMTSLSRQSLLSGKYPRELTKPFSLANEEKEFIAGARHHGYNENQIQFARGYEPNVGPLTKLLAVIINDVDDIVHGQKQGRDGMFNDMSLLGKNGKLQNLIRVLSSMCFTVYITADHGNTPCFGVGGFRSDVGIETRSKRMTVLKDFAEANNLLKENTEEYAGYYLDRSYRYFVCNSGVSFDRKGASVMTHGGISIDEVIVPFIKVGEVKYHE